ncbi:MAG: hypothetical protein O2954_14590 [bacterium]|nr:hypothetical protein [bacterium]
MPNNQIQLDGDPRTLAKAIFQAARESYREKHGKLGKWEDMKPEIETEAAKLAKQMVESLEPDAREVYLINALEVMALSYARRGLKKS